MAEKVIDLRSDTVTRPSAGMRRAMAEAEVGDDVFGDDPTVNRLQARVAELFGKEAALFSPSGTMANQIVFKTVARPTWELVCDRQCHVVNYEVGGPAALSGLLVSFLDSERGFFTPEQLLDSIRPISEHVPLTKIVALENTHNRHGGTVCPIERIRALSEVCGAHGLHFHLDGARIWNAHAASGVALAEYAKYFDTLSVCFSKGMGTPLGSMTLGTKDFIHEARRMRKLFGGGMRQVGVVAAAAIYALDHNLARLAEDHANAQILARGIAQLPGVVVDMSRVETNIVIADVRNTGTSPAEFARVASSANVLVVPFGKTTVRLMTHLDVSTADCHEAVSRLAKRFA